jgi:hypothetical protein
MKHFGVARAVKSKKAGRNERSCDFHPSFSMEAKQHTDKSVHEERRSTIPIASKLCPDYFRLASQKMATSRIPGVSTIFATAAPQLRAMRRREIENKFKQHHNNHARCTEGRRERELRGMADK